MRPMSPKRFSGEICCLSARAFGATKTALEAAGFKVKQIPTEDPNEHALFMSFERNIEIELTKQVETIAEANGGDVIELGIPRVFAAELSIDEHGEVHDLVN